jgi:hypothetical protein
MKVIGRAYENLMVCPIGNLQDVFVSIRIIDLFIYLTKTRTVDRLIAQTNRCRNLFSSLCRRNSRITSETHILPNWLLGIYECIKIRMQCAIIIWDLA